MMTTTTGQEWVQRNDICLQDGAQLQALERAKVDLEVQLEEKLESERRLQQQLADLQQAMQDPESWLTPS